MIKYTIEEDQTQKVSSLSIALDKDDSILVEPGIINCIKGNIEHIPIHNLKHSWNVRMHGRKIIKDVFKGKGIIYIKPSLSQFHKINNEDELIINPACFIACSGNMDIIPFTRNFCSKFFNGVQLIEPLIKGNGEVIFKTKGNIECICLNNEEFISKSPVIAREKNIFSMRSTIAGEKYYVYRGHGKIYAVINPNKANL